MTSYYLALASLVGGWSESTLHAAMLLPALLAVVGAYYLARQLCSHPTLAAAMAMFSPVFIVSATTLMVDVMMLNFFLWAVVAWVDGIRNNRQRSLAISATLILAAELSKYFGASLVPLLAVYTIAFHRGVRPVLLWLLIPVVGLYAYQIYGYDLYGIGLVSSAFGYAASTRTAEGSLSSIRLLTAVSFIGGCLATVVPAAIVADILWLKRGRWTWLVYGLAILILAILLWTGLSPIERYVGIQHLPTSLMIELMIFLICGISVIGLAFIELTNWRNPDALLLALTTLGTLIFAACLNWTVSARNILPIPAFAAIAAFAVWRGPDCWPAPPPLAAGGLQPPRCCLSP